jgi:tRNA threonylcarbamoyladenosine biosynthesis protein TsaB
MNLIAIETATENCSVALLHQGQITERSKIAPQKHAELVLGYLDALLLEQNVKKSQIEGIVFGHGPGAFTGVRIAISMVQGLALAWDVPVLGISTLHNMALQLWQENPTKNQKLLVANDARMGEVYWATFAIKDRQLHRLSEDALSAPEAVNCAGFDVCVGSAFQSMIKVKSNVCVLPQALPDAVTLLTMAQEFFAQNAKNIIEIKPSYIREKVVFN